jgi:hypothetical protein
MIENEWIGIANKIFQSKSELLLIQPRRNLTLR